MRSFSGLLPMVVIAEWSWKPQSPPRRAENPWLTVLTCGVSELPQDRPRPPASRLCRAQQPRHLGWRAGPQLGQGFQVTPRKSLSFSYPHGFTGLSLSHKVGTSRVQPQDQTSQVSVSQAARL